MGAHLPRLDQAGIASFIREDGDRFKETLYGLNRTTSIKIPPEEIEARAAELPEELDDDLQRCALFELEVTENEAEFDPADFYNPDTGLLGWGPAFLSLDGTSILMEACKAPASLRNFRVAFYLHDWSHSGRLVGPTGELQLPPFSPVPERLWRLAPYSPVD